MNETFDEKLNRITEEQRKAKIIICPHCEYEHDSSRDPELLEGHVTYWGEDDAQGFCCYMCGKDFFVKEHVKRTFESKKILKEFEL